MIISRTPFRISFFGGGTDYPDWYRQHGGAVLSTAIDKYCYISVRHLPPFFGYKHRIVYSKVESVNELSEIQHPSVRAVLQTLGADKGLEIHHDGDLPARSGLGTSSTFTVGMVNAIKALRGEIISKSDLAKSALHIEHQVLKECVGTQDSIIAAYGGFRKIQLNPDDTFEATPVVMKADKLQQLQDNLMLFFTGFSRYAAEVAKAQIANMEKKKQELKRMLEMVDQALSILSGKTAKLDEFGKLLHETWQYKRSLADAVSTPAIDEIYQAARDSGALGGKLLGAGGGGFMLFFAKPEDQPRIKEKLKHLIHVTFRFETGGSKIVLYESDNFS
ncbi:MAG: kinase [Candidatus Omnitrophica bacterium]|nr:kinase [Candidatus Omnitrophota bacterium]